MTAGLKCACHRPIVSHLGMDFCGSCFGALDRNQQFYSTGVPMFAGQYVVCSGCGALVTCSKSAKDLHVEFHADLTRWMQSLAVKVTEMHSYIQEDALDKAAAKCQEILESMRVS